MSTQQSSAGTDAGSGTVTAENNTDTLDADLEAMREADEAAEASQGETEAAGQQQTGAQDGTQGQEGREAGENGEPGKGGGKPPLTPDELNARWRQSQAAMHEERTARQAGESRIAELERRIQELSAGGGKPQQGQQQEFDPLNSEIPDPNEDPAGAFLAMVNLARALQADRKTTDQQTTQASEGRQQLQSLVQTFQTAEGEYRTSVPDYDDAVKHMRERRIEELTLFGQSPQQATASYQREILGLVNAAMRSGQHPAHVLYQLSQKRGYTKPAPAEKTAEEKAAEMAQHSDAMKLSKTLSGGGGKAKRGGPTVEQINTTRDGDEFDKLFDELEAMQSGR